MKYSDIYRKGNHATIKVKPSPTADTRTCDFTKVDLPTLEEASWTHRHDVQMGINFFCNILQQHAVCHDWDKLEDIAGFHANFKTGFTERDWLDRHYQKNRHHLENPNAIPEKLNLLDVLEHIVDQVVAGMSRSGEVRPVEISPELLQAAVANTVELLKDHVEVVASG